MDQARCYHVDDFDPSTVNLERPATTVDEYLKQVVVTRMNCTDVAYAKIDPSKIKSSISSSSSKGPETNDKCSYAPDRKWQDEFIIRFARDRENIEKQRSKIKALKVKNLPPAADGKAWSKICLRERHSEVPILSSQESIYAAHQGTPPTLRFVLSFSDVFIDKLIQHLFTAFQDYGYSRALFEWLYSLLMVVKTPLQHDAVSTLRSFVKECRKERAKLGKNDKEKIIEYTIFIAIVSLHFSQRDLAD